MRVMAVVDPDNALVEPDEGNNRVTGRTNIACNGGKVKV